MSVLVPLDQMSETSVPNEVRVLPEADQTAFGSIANNEDEALPTTVLVLVLIVDAIDEEAVVTSDWRAKAPISSPAPVKVRVVLFQTSATNVPNVVKLRALYDQIVAGSIENNEDEALPTVVFTAAVPAVIADPREDEAVVTSD